MARSKEQNEFAKALYEEAEEIVLQRRLTTRASTNMSTNYCRARQHKDSESAGGGGRRGRRRSRNCLRFSVLSKKSYSLVAFISEARHFLRNAKMGFLAARAA